MELTFAVIRGLGTRNEWLCRGQRTSESLSSSITAASPDGPSDQREVRVI